MPLLAMLREGPSAVPGLSMLQDLVLRKWPGASVSDIETERSEKATDADWFGPVTLLQHKRPTWHTGTPVRSPMQDPDGGH